MTFADFALKPTLLQALDESGFVHPTPVQRDCIPPSLEGRDIVGVAQTGTGKTLAFLVPILNKLQPRGRVQAIVVCPTRELAQQVAGVAERLGASLGVRATVVYGGTSLAGQRAQLDEEPDIVVGTPGRLIDFLGSAWLRPRWTRWLVLDEADRMLDMGFIEDVRTICARVPLSRQTMLFSATMPPAITALADQFLYEPVTVRVSQQNIVAEGIEHRVYELVLADKPRALARLLQAHRGEKVLIFTATREATSEVASRLRRSGHEVVSLSSLLSQANRERALACFRRGEFPVMVATDVAARGLDVTDIDIVVNYDLPQTAEDYVHRVGRTGRAARNGVAISLVSPADQERVAAIEWLLGQPLPRHELDGFRRPAPRVRRGAARRKSSGAGSRQRRKRRTLSRRKKRSR
ncbi:MAG: DEAD/DEAH box helicase [Acidobacteriota bacterium]|nr:MAG: DEAD/DEAH box helicase [Acidobacteriota bacterium]